ncbi:MAG: hypothetical protein C4307_03780 [Chloroflexota bacterium]
MRRVILALFTAGMLAGAGVAIADSVGAKSIAQLTATFTATTVSDLSSRTCTNTDGTWVDTRARYTGISTSANPDLSGPLTLRARSLINTTKNLGLIEARGQVDVSSGPDTVIRLDGVYAGGKVSGLLVGRGHAPSVRLVGDVSSDFGASTGFANGKIGGTDAGGAAVALERGPCPGPLAETVKAKGKVDAVSSISITVAGVTCEVPAELSSQVSGLTVGDQAEIRCRRQDGKLVLVKVEKKSKKK